MLCLSVRDAGVKFSLSHILWHDMSIFESCQELDKWLSIFPKFAHWSDEGYVTEVPLQILRRYQSNMVRPWHFWPRTTVSHILSFFCARRTSIEEGVNLDFSSLCRQVTSAFGRSVPSRSIELLVCLHSSPFLSDFQFRRAIFSS